MSRVLSVPSCKAIYHPVTARPWLLGFLSFVLQMLYFFILSKVFANLKVTISMYNQRSLPTRLDHFVHFVINVLRLIDFCGADVQRKVG